MKVLNFLGSLVSLLYPNLCAACDRTLFRGENMICVHCRSKLPFVPFRGAKNELMERFWGRVNLVQAYSLFYYRKKGRVQNILRKVKYQGRQDLCHYLGLVIAEKLQNDPDFIYPDILVPVPLHFTRKMKRGYNQSEEIAKGIGEGLKLPLNKNLLKRKKNSSSQTRKGRFLRWKETSELYHCRDHQTEKGQHIMLVDDVITTGSTIEACCAALDRSGFKRISAVSVSMA